MSGSSATKLRRILTLMQLRWPTPQEYNEAVQCPRLAFSDSELQTGEPELNSLGLPRPISGGFATVYHLTCSQRSWAIRCFLQSAYDQELRYAKIAKHLSNAGLPYTVGFEYQPAGIKIRGRILPLLKMEWIDGITLDEFVRAACYDSEVMLVLANEFLGLHHALLRLGMAHGDLQHGNVMISRKGLHLVDYDGMYVPALNGSSASELGHPNYQHPLRNSAEFGALLDNFSAWVIFISLYALGVDAGLWDQLGGGDECLLFRRSDFTQTEHSPAFQLLESHNNADVRELCRYLRRYCQGAVRQVPPLPDELKSLVKSDRAVDYGMYIALHRQQQQELRSENQSISTSGIFATQDGSMNRYDALSTTQAGRNQKLNSGHSGSMQFDPAIAAGDAFGQGRFAEAVPLYQALLTQREGKPSRYQGLSQGFRSTHSGEDSAQSYPFVRELEYRTRLAFCHVYMENLHEARVCFTAARAQALTYGDASTRMRCCIWIAAILASEAADKGITEIDESFYGGYRLRIESERMSATMLLRALSLETKGPMNDIPLLGDLAFHLGKSRESVDLYLSKQFYELAIESYEKSTGPNSKQLALTLQRHASCCSRLGVRVTVEDELKRALQILQHTTASTDPEVQSVLLDLTRYYIFGTRQQLKLASSQTAAPFLRQALECANLMLPGYLWHEELDELTGFANKLMKCADLDAACFDVLLKLRA